MASFLITGANRGFGLALAKELLSRPASEVGKIIATSRKPSTDLDSLVKSSSGRVAVVTIDVSDEASIKKSVPEVEKVLGGQGLDVLINNAGIAQYSMNGTKSMDNLLESMQVNVLGVHWMTRNYLPLLEKGHLKKVANIASTLGSLSLQQAYTFMPAPAYKITKTTLNALTVQYALDYAKEGFSFMALCPGWMKTELGGGDMADLTAEQGAKASVDIIFRPNAETNGQMPKVFVKGFETVEGPHRYDGSNAPW